MSFFFPDPTFYVVYLTGIPEFENKSPANLTIRKDGIKISIPFKSEKIITWDKIKRSTFETEGSLQESKTFSGGKALTGLVLLGPLGLIFGAGGKTHKVDTRKTFLQIDYINAFDELGTVILEAKDAHNIINKIDNQRLKAKN